MSTGVHNTLHARMLVGAGISLSFMASIASAYDFGCQYIWEEPSPDNDLKKCIMDLPRNNPGVLMPPIIPVLFFVFVFISYPIIFLCRICGGCGSNTQRPGAGCCCDGEEWDDVDEIEKSRLYPRRHVCVIKMLCLVVVVCSIIPIIITPIGFKYIKEFWDSFYYQTETEIIEWAETEVEILLQVVAP
eukprot:Tbor_TRINITY_DN6174_c2_g2::TRINITY_DN6174_c2_g2_i4::g.21419::m.21419